MTIRVAINGYGRIGRCIVRALYEYNRKDEIQIVAVNDLAGIDVSAHITQYDTAHGKFNAVVDHTSDELIINGDKIKYYSETDPEKLPWAELEVDLVMDCTGRFKSRELASKHLNAGAKKVLISAPAKGEVDATIVYGVNDNVLKPEHQIVSNASCTTNCLAPLVKPLHDAIGVESGLMTSIHAYTNDQVLSDTAHADLHRARSATMSQIPTSTGAAKAVGLVLPELNGKLDGFAMRVPTINVSIVDLVFQASRPTTIEEVNSIMLKASQQMPRILGYNDKPLVSIDFNHNPASSTFDASLTNIKNGTLVQVFSWYDNEWGFSNRMIDTALKMMSF
ncbi:MAG: type I glyceraldehyde-3-phosphate dehydrogenase [Gammaproteobacteria bacterium]|jgi:glyceraldehyde 3-phosphate dehydrogenase|nr:type I glyceraldehyde-3-phosphate dehydrogenase [Xanthomonadales bacterium]MCB1603809.1 type I glyceraldehyde-3-phosphate dehydrogenase [Xanthomonadales bacterium]